MESLEETLPASERLKSPMELLAITDHHDFRFAVADYVFAKHRIHGWESLTAFERVIWHALDCEFREAQWTLLYEAFEGDERCSTLVAALEEIGAYRAADGLRRVYALYAAVPPERAANAHTLGDWIELVGEKPLEVIRSTLIDNEVQHCLCTYINERRIRLRPD